MNQNLPRVSIITAVYNGEPYIERCVQSLLAQTYPNIEYVVVDGASKDATLSILRKYENRIDRLISEPDKGAYDGMNKGIAAATGDIIGFLNADDVFADNQALQDLLAPFSAPDVVAVYGNLVMVDANGNPSRQWFPGRYTWFKAISGWHPPHPTFYCRAAILKTEGVFDTRYRISADIDVMIRILRHYPRQVVYVNREIIRMLAGGMSNANLKVILKANWECYKAFRQQQFSVPLAAFAVIGKLTRKVLQLIASYIAKA